MIKRKQDSDLKFLFKDTYLQAIKNSVGSRIFSNLYFQSGSKRRDVAEAGSLSCAAFTTYILKIFDLIGSAHATVNGTLKDLERSGWHQINRPKPGALIVWAEKAYKGVPHRHIGFFIGSNKAISNSSEAKTPQVHHWTYGAKTSKSYRPVLSIWWHDKLENLR